MVKIILFSRQGDTQPEVINYPVTIINEKKI